MKNRMDRICDIHCHILFGVDDGSKSFAQSRNMLKIACDEGIREIIATPHYNPGRWAFDSEHIKKCLQELNECAVEINPEMKIHLGSEVFFCQDTLDDLTLEKIPTMANSRYVLLEFMPSVSYRKIQTAVLQVHQCDKIPIIAHVERYDCLLEDNNLISDLIELGAYIQVNASSVTGENGRTAKHMVRELLKYHEVHFIATDAHRDDIRSPRMRECAEYVAKKYGLEYANRIFYDNPYCIIENKLIEE